MTDAELLAEIAEIHGSDAAELVAQIIAGERAAAPPRRMTRAGDRHTRAGAKGRSGVFIVGGRGRKLSIDPGNVVAGGNGRGPRG